MDKILNVNISAANLQYLYAQMKYRHIPDVTNAKVTSFENHTVTYSADGEEKQIPADTVIVSVGCRSVNPFADTLQGEHVHVIGDVSKVANLMGCNLVSI